MNERRTPAMRAVLDAIDAHIGRRLRYQRTLTGLSQMKLGNQSGVSFQQIQKYEGGVNGISASSLLLFAHILNVPVNWFYEEITPSLWGNTCSPPLSKADDGLLYRRETLDLIRTYYQLTKEHRRSFGNLLRSTAERVTEKS